MRVTIDDLASKLGISAASVSYALNGQPGVSEATRARVRALADELDWHPSSSARALSRSRSDSVGIILRRDPGLLGAEPYYMNLLAGIESVLSAADQTLLFRMIGSRNTDDAAIYRKWSGERRVDGVMLFDHTVDDGRPGLLSDLNIPFVAHGSAMTDIGGPTFTYDLVADAEMVVGHLHALGHRAIGHLGGSRKFSNELNRMTVMRAAARARGMEYLPFEGDYGIDLATRITRQVLQTENAPTAIVTSNDVMALGVTAALRELGRRDVAIVAFDDSLLCRIAVPSITALERFTEEQGRRSTRMLLSMLDGAGEIDPTAVPSVLEIRGSSVRPAVA